MRRLRRHRILLSVIPPVLLVTTAFAVLFIRLVVPGLQRQFIERAFADLEAATQEAIELCENGLGTLLEMRLEEEPAMVETLRRDTLEQIKRLPSRFPGIQVAVVEQGTLVTPECTEIGSAAPVLLNLPAAAPETAMELTLADPTYAHWRYFPFWRRHIIAYVSLSVAMAPLTSARRVVLAALLGGATTMLAAFVVTFVVRVDRPLRKLARTANVVSAGRFENTGITRQDEIGAVARAFDAMVASLMEKDAQLRTNMRELEDSVQEKEVLLREIHHRVRNNLNIIESLLRLRADSLTDTSDVIQAFQESTDRIRTMAMIHSRLYESGDFSRIRLDEHIRDLVTELIREYPVYRQVTLEMDVRVCTVAVDQAIPLGLLVNEAVTNALKHAFSGPTTGVLRVGLRPVETLPPTPLRYLLTIADNGPGIPQQELNTPGGSLGMTLIRELAAQVHGELRVSTDSGTTVAVMFMA
jgi:two-component sensor histidine kinase